MGVLASAAAPRFRFRWPEPCECQCSIPLVSAPQADSQPGAGETPSYGGVVNKVL